MTNPYPGNGNWPIDFNAGTLTGKFVDVTGLPMVGKTITLTPTPVNLVDYTYKTVILGSSITITLDTNGSFSTVVPGTNDPDIQPIKWNYQVKENFGPGRTYYIEVPIGQTTDLSIVSPVPRADGVSIVRGATGEVSNAQLSQAISTEVTRSNNAYAPLKGVAPVAVSS